MTVVRSLTRRDARFSSCMVCRMSRLEVASSSSSTSVACARLRAKMTRWRSPPLNWLTGRFSKPSRSASSKMLSTTARSSAPGRAKPGDMRIASHHDDFPAGVGKIDAKILRNQCDSAGQVFARVGGKEAPVEPDVAGVGLQMPGKQIDQRGFSAAIGTDDAVKMAPFDGQRQIGDDGFGAIGEFDAVQVV